MLGLPELDGDVEGGHRKHAAPLHPGSGRGPRHLSARHQPHREDRGAAILALDAAGEGCSAVVGAGGEVLAVRHEAMLHGQAEALLPMVDAAMRAAGLAASSLDLVAVSTGPGSFTGIRVGLAAAQGVAFGAALPLIGVTSFVAAAILDPAPVGGVLLVALESRRADLYVQIFDAAALPLSEPAAILPEGLTGLVAAIAGTRPLAITGGAAARADAALAGRGAASIIEPTAPAAVGVLRAAWRRWQAGKRDGPVRPFYLRPPDATPASGRTPAGRS